MPMRGARRCKLRAMESHLTDIGTTLLLTGEERAVLARVRHGGRGRVVAGRERAGPARAPRVGSRCARAGLISQPARGAASTRGGFRVRPSSENRPDVAHENRSWCPVVPLPRGLRAARPRTRFTVRASWVPRALRPARTGCRRPHRPFSGSSGDLKTARALLPSRPTQPPTRRLWHVRGLPGRGCRRRSRRPGDARRRVRPVLDHVATRRYHIVDVIADPSALSGGRNSARRLTRRRQRAGVPAARRPLAQAPRSATGFNVFSAATSTLRDRYVPELDAVLLTSRAEDELPERAPFEVLAGRSRRCTCDRIGEGAASGGLTMCISLFAGSRCNDAAPRSPSCPESRTCRRRSGRRTGCGS